MADTLSDLSEQSTDSGIGDSYLNAIKQFEGFSPQATWDYGQYTNGYGTKALHPGEVIDQATADQRFQSEISSAQAQVDKAFPQLPAGARAALTSLTFNAGPGWMNSGLGDAVRNGDWDTAKAKFQQYNKAGGQTLPGLMYRRGVESAWLTGVSPEMTQSPQVQSPSAPAQTPSPAQGMLTNSMPQASPQGMLGQQPQQQSYNNSMGSLGSLLQNQGQQQQRQQQAPAPPLFTPISAPGDAYRAAIRQRLIMSAINPQQGLT